MVRGREQPFICYMSKLEQPINQKKKTRDLKHVAMFNYLHFDIYVYICASSRQLYNLVSVLKAKIASYFANTFNSKCTDKQANKTNWRLQYVVVHAS